MKACRRVLRPGLAIAGVMYCTKTAAAPYEVRSIAELQSRIDKAVAGDALVVRGRRVIRGRR